MKNILLATDFSDLSGYAKDLAVKIAESLHCRLHLLNIVELPSGIHVNSDGELYSEWSDDVEYFKQAKKAADEKMKNLLADIKVETTHSVQYDELHDGILQYAQKNEINLIVIGTHGVSGIEELFSGSVTEHLIKKSDIPVLSLKCNRDSIDFSDFLITGDFKPRKADHLKLLKQLQTVFNSTMHLLWVNTRAEFVTSSEAHNKMRQFAEINELLNVEYHVHNDINTEEGIVNFSENYDNTHALDIDIIAVQKKKKGIQLSLSRCEATSFVNHVFRPILVYTNF